MRASRPTGEPAEVVVLGGGVGGTLTANLLARRLRGAARVRLVDATGLHVYQPGFLYLALGGSARRLMRDTRSLLRDDVELLIDRAVRIDADSGKIELERGAVLAFDHLVVALGATLDHGRVPGLREGGHDFYTLAGAERLREALRGFRGGTILVGIAGMPYKCPPAPVEFALMLDDLLRRRGVRTDTTIKFLSPLNRAFAIESASKLVAPIFERKGIELHTFVNVDAVDPVQQTVATLEDETYAYDLAVLIPPHTTPAVLRESGLTAGGDWVPVDRESLRVEGRRNVFAIGDCTNLPISKAGSTAHFQAPVVVEQIAAAIQHRAPNARKGRYHGKVMCFLETGDRRATYMVFDYDHPPTPPRPSVLWHAAKWAFNRTYWSLVPTGRI